MPKSPGIIIILILKEDRGSSAHVGVMIGVTVAFNFDATGKRNNGDQCERIEECPFHCNTFLVVGTKQI
jgi:hypothetical protein